MLEDLTIKDFALIDSDYIEFTKGFTVLSGETGAGKSILIGALSFLLGGKADTSVIRFGKEEASVSGTFVIPENKAADSKAVENEDDIQTASQWLTFHGIETENNRVILRRFIRSSGKSAAWINSTPVTRADLSQFSSFLVDIHGQHEHQSLMKVSEHRKFLDERAGITDEVLKFKELYTHLVEKRAQYEKLSSSEGEIQHKIEMYSFGVKEIEDAKLKKDEDSILETEESKLSSFEKLYSDIDTVDSLLSNTDEGIVSSIKKALREMSHACEIDKSLDELNKRLDSSFYEISDISDEISNYKSKLQFDPQRLSEIQDRLSLIYNLKKKYASSVNAPLSEVFDYYNQAKAFLEENNGDNSKKDQLLSEIKALEKTCLIKAEELTKKRKACGAILEKEVGEILSQLGMKGTTFGVSIVQKDGSDVEQKCGPYGKDNIEFMISANPGNPLHPLAKIASGGELSRVMLALKTIFAQVDSVETLIFDEIDTGIGGEVAVAVGNHIKKLASNRQIFCITHLASIAVYADNQIKIEKSVNGQYTSSNVHLIKGEERVVEIARMLSGDSDTSQSLEHARSLLNKYSGGF